MKDIFRFLSENGIDFERFDHPPVYTVADVHRLTPDLPGAKTKNLFFHDSKNDRHFLVVVPGDGRIDMKALPGVLESGRVRFGSPERLKNYLGIEPGSVSLLAIVNDPQHAVEVIVDETLWESDAYQFHPLINTSTLVISRNGIQRFLSATGHEPRIASVPTQR
jgi:Ala-tRNA(Pro) deacylase